MQDDNRELKYHPTIPGLRAIGFLDDGCTPVWPVLGAADDDDEGGEIDLEGGGTGNARKSDVLDEDDDDETEEDAGASEDEDEEDKKPSAKPKARTEEDFKRLEAALEKERTLRKKREGMIAEFRRKERDANAEGDDAAAEQARQAGEAAAAKYKPVAIRTAAKAALLEANLQNPTEERIRRLVARLDVSEIDVDDDGDVIGLQEQIEQLQDDFPELFTAPATATTTTVQKPKAPKISTADKKPGPTEYKTTGEKLAARITSGQ